MSEITCDFVVKKFWDGMQVDFTDNGKMETGGLNANHAPSFLHQSLPVVVPMLLISVGYVDPGKWVAFVEGGGRFGFDLMAFTLIFNFAAIFCQYISAKIGVITGKDLAQICTDEYDSWTCMLLGVQAELSVIMLDLNMIMGMAHGLNVLFGWDLFTCVFLTATGAVFHLLLFVLLDIEKVKILGLFVSGFVFLSFVLGILINQPEIPLSINGILTKLSGESAFVLMSLLGATLVPHNFYLHSSIVQWHEGSTTISKDVLCHNHFLAIICVFSGLYLVNNVLMNAAANEFYSMGLVLTTFQDALSPMEQVLRSPIAMLAFLLILFFSNQTTALTWSFGGEVVVHSFLKLDIPGWLHYATIRVIAVLPALYCVWSSGAEGMYQLLIFTQIVVALQLPSSVIPLFRIASSRSIMGVHKIPQFVEFLALIIFIGMLVLNIVFVVEMIFGSSDWVGNLRWNVGNGVSLTYLVLLCTAFASFSLMLWLAATPLKSASVQLDDQVWNWDMPQAVPKPQIDNEETDINETRYHGDASVQVKEPSPALARTLEYPDVPVSSFHHNLPETIMEPDVPLSTVRETLPFTSFSCAPTSVVKELASTSESEAVPVLSSETSDIRLGDAQTLKTETCAPVGKTVEVEGDSNAERDDDDGDSWETEEAPKAVSLAPSSASDGPASFRSLSGKSDDGGNSIGSLSRLAGLGRGARRQLAAILDEFWGQLYDFHGQFTQEAKANKFDVLLGVDSRLTGSLQKVDACGKEYFEHLISLGSRAPDTLMNSAPYDSSKQHRMLSNLESSYRPQRSYSSLQANPVQFVDEYVQTPSCNLLSAGERRYSSVRNLSSSRALDYQPATIHGYQVASYINWVGKDTNSDNLNGLMELSSLKSTSMGNTNNYRNSIAFAMGQKMQNGSGLSQPPGFQNIAKNCQLPSERSYYDSRPSGPVDNAVSSVNAKRYHSLPDISGYAPHRDVYTSDKSVPWDGPVGGYRSSATRTHYEPSFYTTSGSRTGAPLPFDLLSPSKDYTDVLSSGVGTGSLWSRQPFEQFGVDDKIRNAATEDVGNRPSATTREITSVVDIDGKLLQSFRHCILKLLKLEGSDWLFKQNDGADEDLIDRVAAREKFVYEVETTEMNRANHSGETRYFSSEGKSCSSMKNNESNWSSFSVTSIPHCGEECVWRADIITSFGVWCIHRVLDLSLMESRPELWGKYTYVLNRLQGIIDLAFSKPRSPSGPCFCLQVPMTYQQKSSSPPSNGMLPPAAKPGRGKCTTASVVFEMVKDVEIAISSRKGRTGTAAGDVAFPKGKENLASVLKRYKRRLSNKPVGTQEGIRKIPTSAPYNL
ncbi:Ethylene-insensitive protein 2 [Mucuna pruriens]|uniref:Ethylene-insensitive protein 2 n=1 Tax=Mucuna pruriens TaxID=157652 RepID=A0A371DZW5_MUCPR|nr:Ethylene-insensitive protein 2 [Mucuna pruriens]